MSDLNSKVTQCLGLQPQCTPCLHFTVFSLFNWEKESEVVAQPATSRLPSVRFGSSTRVSATVGETMPATLVLVVSDVSSGVGKTSIAVGIMAALSKRHARSVVQGWSGLPGHDESHSCMRRNSVGKFGWGHDGPRGGAEILSSKLSCESC